MTTNQKTRLETDRHAIFYVSCFEGQKYFSVICCREKYVFEGVNPRNYDIVKRKKFCPYRNFLSDSQRIFHAESDVLAHFFYLVQFFLEFRILRGKVPNSKKKITHTLPPRIGGSMCIFAGKSNAIDRFSLSRRSRLRFHIFLVE